MKIIVDRYLRFVNENGHIKIMHKKTFIIDIFVDIVDNYGDMGFACESILALETEYPGIFTYVIWTNNTQKMTSFITSFGL